VPVLSPPTQFIHIGRAYRRAFRAETLLYVPPRATHYA